MIRVLAALAFLAHLACPAIAQTLTLPAQQVNVDIYPLLRAHSITEYQTLRGSLINFVWKGAGIPSALPNLDVDYTAYRPSWVSVPNTTMRAAHVRDPITPDVYGVLFLLEPPGDGDCLFVYNMGHGGIFRGGAGPLPGEIELVNTMLAKGCDVIGSMMPYQGDNQTSSVSFPSASGSLHNYFAPAETSAGTPIRYFLTPPIVGINWAISRNGPYARIGMAGLSGGGWTTSFIAALDTRITHSYSVAGSMPSHLRPYRPQDTGDWEQSVSAWLQIADYLDLYILGALEPLRSSMEVWNPGDSCCFDAVQSYTFTNQLAGIASRFGVSGLNFFITGVSAHTVASSAVARISADFGP